MKDKYKQLMHKMVFLEMLSLRLRIRTITLQGYFAKNGTIPPKHKEIILKALELRLSADKKIKEIELNAFEQL